MANHFVVSSIKNHVISELSHDAEIMALIQSPETGTENRIFPYHQDTDALSGTGTFLTVQVHIPQTENTDPSWFTVRLEIWVISHKSCMTLSDPLPSANRNDFISQLLDKKLNGRKSLGLEGAGEDRLHLCGKLNLVSSVEGALPGGYLYRQLLFETENLKEASCGC